jgi:hypothetical protein
LTLLPCAGGEGSAGAMMFDQREGRIAHSRGRQNWQCGFAGRAAAPARMARRFRLDMRVPFLLVHQPGVGKPLSFLLGVGSAMTPPCPVRCGKSRRRVRARRRGAWCALPAVLLSIVRSTTSHRDPRVGSHVSGGDQTAWLGMSDSNSEMSLQIIPLKGRKIWGDPAEREPLLYYLSAARIFWSATVPTRGGPLK